MTRTKDKRGEIEVYCYIVHTLHVKYYLKMTVLLNIHITNSKAGTKKDKDVQLIIQ